MQQQQPETYLTANVAKKLRDKYHECAIKLTELQKDIDNASTQKQNLERNLKEYVAHKEILNNVFDDLKRRREALIKGNVS